MDQIFLALGFTLVGVVMTVAIVAIVLRVAQRPRRSAEPDPSPLRRAAVSSAQSLVVDTPVPSAAASGATPRLRTIGSSIGSASARTVLRDTVDPELFSVFHEEAADLLQRIEADLHHWMLHSGNTAQRDAMLRMLHMLKGSARVAGASRLGEDAERMGVEIKALSQGPMSLAGFQQLAERLEPAAAVQPLPKTK